MDLGLILLSELLWQCFLLAQYLQQLGLSYP